MSKFQAHKDAPDEVWLQIGYGDEGKHTWSSHQVAEDDIEQAGPYVRADRLSGRVRSLGEWRKGYCDEHVTITQASTGFGSIYQVRILDGVVWLDMPDQYKKKFNSVEEAKAAAQADFEARILAALDPAPTPDAILALIPTGGSHD